MCILRFYDTLIYQYTHKIIHNNTQQYTHNIIHNNTQHFLTSYTHRYQSGLNHTSVRLSKSTHLFQCRVSESLKYSTACYRMCTYVYRMCTVCVPYVYLCVPYVYRMCTYVYRMCTVCVPMCTVCVPYVYSHTLHICLKSNSHRRSACIRPRGHRTQGRSRPHQFPPPRRRLPPKPTGDSASSRNARANRFRGK